MDRRQILALLPTLAAGLAMTSFPQPLSAQTPDPDAPFTALLARYVIVGRDGLNRVDYARWHANAADRAALDTYIAEMARRRPSGMARDEAFAYWANLYNAITLKVILDRYPVASIREIRSEGVWTDPRAWTGPWRSPRVTVEGRALSLDDIEHEVMRPTFKDPLVHYAVNCASIGCPNLMPKAWGAATLAADLDAAARAFVNHPRGVSFRRDGGLVVSSIYSWFIVDFGNTEAGVIAHLRRYAAPELAARLATATRIAEDQYDWALNRPLPRSGS